MRPETLRRATEHRSGQIVILGAFALVILGLVAALAIDIGHVLCVRAMLQNGADAASLAAAHKLVERLNAGDSEQDARAAAAVEGATIAGMNCSEARCVVSFGEYESGVFTPLDSSSEATAIQIQVFRDADAPDGAVKTTFASLAGLTEIEVRAPAVSQLGRGISGIRAGSDLRPFAVHEDDVAGWVAGEPIQIDLPSGHGGGDGSGAPPGGPQAGQEEMITPGNWGWLNMDGGSQGVPELSDWILNGYDGDISLDQTGDDGKACTWIDGSCGVKHALQSDFEQILGQPILLCIYDEVVGQGANTDFRIVGFVAINFTGIDFHGNEGTIEGEMMKVTNVPYIERGPGMSPHSNLCRVQLVK